MDNGQVTGTVGASVGGIGPAGMEVPPTGLAAAATVSDLLNDAPRSRFHRRAVVISGMGFFTDAYDLFVISTVAVLVKAQWHLSTTQTSWVAGSTILAAFIGALVFGRIADVLGRKSVYALVAVIMIVGAVTSAFATGFWWLVIARFVLGLGIGGDYPVSAVLMSEYANRDDRGRLVGLVFSMQALGLIVGPLVGLLLLSSGVNHDLTWRLMLGLGAVPAAAVVYLRAKMPESPRFQARVQGEADRAASQLALFSEGVVERTDDWLSRWPSPDRARPVPDRSANTPAPPRHGGGVVSLRLRLLRQHPLPASHFEGSGPSRDIGHQARVDPWHLHGLRGAWISACLHQDGQDRPPSPPAHRLRCHGRCICGPGCRPGSHDRRGTLPPHLRIELLLHRVRTQHHDVRSAV